MALDFTTWCGFNFRQSNGTNFTADGTNEFGMVNPQTVYPTDPDKGWMIAPVSTANSGLAIDRRVYGVVTANGGSNIFAVNAPNATYDLRMAMGHTAAAFRTGTVVVDSLDSRINNITAILAASGNVSLNGIYVTADNLRLYIATTAGSYTGDPVGTGTGIKAGTGSETARFAFLANVVHISDSVSTVATTDVWDVDGSARAQTTWPTAGSSAPKFKTITVQNGGLKFCRHPSANMYIRHVGLLMHTTPLQAVDLRDYAGVSLGSNPSIHAGQPTGKLIAQLYFAVGSTANISLGGTLAPYFQVVTRGADKWLASLLPIPDGTTGDLQIIQTDSTASITGSPYTTTFSTSGGTLTIVSSQGKPTLTTGVSGNTLAYALISTQCWLNHKLVRDTVEAAWNGWTNQTFTNDIAVSSDAELATAITTVNAAVGSGVWQRIRITGGSYSDRTWTTADYSQGGTGGLLVQGAGSHTITSWFDNGGWRGVHFDNLTFSTATISAIGLRGSNRSDKNHEVVVTGCTFGNAARTMDCIKFFSGKSLRVRNCTFQSFSNGVTALGVRSVEIGGNTFRDFNVDFIDASAFSRSQPDGMGVLADDHQYLWAYDNKGYKAPDEWGGYVTNNNPHCDALQHSTTLGSWTTGTVYAAGTWVMSSGNLYKTAAGGTAGATAPTHSSGTVSDGGVSWEFVSTIANGPRIYMSLHGLRYHGASHTYSDITGYFIAATIGFLTDSGGGLPVTASVFNNICGSTSTWSGWRHFGDATQPNYVEYNTFGGPAYCPDVANPPPVSGAAIVDEATIQGGGVFARKNISGALVSVEFNEDNIQIPWAGATNPGLNLTGPITQDNTNNDIWGYSSLNEDAAPDAFARQLESILTPLPAYEGYGAIASQSASSGGSGRNTGLSLGLSLGL